MMISGRVPETRRMFFICAVASSGLSEKAQRHGRGAFGRVLSPQSRVTCERLVTVATQGEYQMAADALSGVGRDARVGSAQVCASEHIHAIVRQGGRRRHLLVGGSAARKCSGYRQIERGPRNSGFQPRESAGVTTLTRLRITVALLAPEYRFDPAAMPLLQNRRRHRMLAGRTDRCCSIGYERTRFTLVSMGVQPRVAASSDGLQLAAGMRALRGHDSRLRPASAGPAPDKTWAAVQLDTV